ncbi:MAG: cell division protein FtsL [Polyangiales bacterium]|nr:cell division protein FtsL [Myxococcales bacterium]MCB9657016.1 cell division protein FtsL [Sandaracinaceae bacterium]
MSARFLVLWFAAVVATAAAVVVHLSIRAEVVRLGYSVGDARREQRGLVESRRQLALEAATLRQAARIETVARGSLGMSVPTPSRIVPIGNEEAHRRATAGRVR